MKCSVFILFAYFVLTGCSNYDKTYLANFVWKHASGYYINDFIYFGDDYMISNDMEIIHKDTCVGRLKAISKKELIITSCDTKTEGFYILHDSSDKRRYELRSGNVITRHTRLRD